MNEDENDRIPELQSILKPLLDHPVAEMKAMKDFAKLAAAPLAEMEAI